MLINNILYTIIISILTAVVLWSVSWFVRKKLKNSQSFVIGFFLAGVFFVGMLYGIGRLYVVDENNEVHTYRAFGTFEYELADGNKITRTYNSDSVMIINNSFNTLVLEEIIYAIDNNTGTPDVYEIAGWSCQSFSLPENQVHYFFDDEIDESMNTRDTKPVSRFWLHGTR